MNTGMELMGMKECRECGDPYTVTMDDAGICSGCAWSHELAALKARVAELEAKELLALKPDATTRYRALDAAENVVVEGASLDEVIGRVRALSRDDLTIAGVSRGIVIPRCEPQPTPPVVVTREMVEALAEFVNLHALWMSEPRTDDDLTKPLNAAARAVVAMNRVLEVKP